MNRIHAAEYQAGSYSEPHLAIWVDGSPLHDLLARHVPELTPHDLVPTWLDWMINDAEQELVHSRMWPEVGSCTRVPILMCPDDLDFSCSLVIADVSATDEMVIWNRIGIDATRSGDPSSVGSEVEWFTLLPLAFRRDEYLECVRAFSEANRMARLDASDPFVNSRNDP